MIKLCSILAGALVSLVMAVPALADALPEDVPVTYGSPEMDQNAETAPAEQESMLEMDDEAVTEGTPDSISQNMNDENAVRPGDAPKTNSFTIQLNSELRFASPFTPATVNATNPAGSTVITRYELRISPAELMRQIGRTGYSEAEWNELNAQPGFDPEESTIVLAGTKGIAPGSVVKQMTLSALPDGSTLDAGDYRAQMTVLAYSTESYEKSMIDSVVHVRLHVLSGEASLDFNRDGQGRLGVYNPTTQQEKVVFKIEISQQSLVDGCGSPHRLPEEMEAQASSGSFDPAYEFLTLYESEPVAPGGSLDQQIQLLRLPDGESLPGGQYTAWLTRYTYNEALGDWFLKDARTQLNLTVG